MKEEILKNILELKITSDNLGYFKTMKSMMPWENPYQEGFLLHLGTLFYFSSSFLLALGIITLFLKIILFLFSKSNYDNYETSKYNVSLLSEKLSNMDKSDFHLMNKNEKHSLYKNVKKEYKKAKLNHKITSFNYNFKFSFFSFYALPVSIVLFLGTWGFIFVDYLNGIEDESVKAFESYMENPTTTKNEILRFEKLSDNEFLIVYKDNLGNTVNEIYNGSFKFKSDIDKPYYEYVDRFEKEDLVNSLVYSYFSFEGRDSDYVKKFNFGKSNIIVYLPDDFDINKNLNNKN